MQEDEEKQIVIYGKNGHAEVLGLVGQTTGKAIVIEKLEEAAGWISPKAYACTRRQPNHWMNSAKS